MEIPAGFERGVLRGSSTTVGLYADAAYFLIYRQFTTGPMEVTRTMSAGIEIRRLEAAGTPRPRTLIARDPLLLVADAIGLVDVAGPIRQYEERNPTFHHLRQLVVVHTPFCWFDDTYGRSASLPES